MPIPSQFERSEIELLVRMVRAPASGGDEGPVAEIVQRGIDWTAFLGHAQRHGVLPLVHRYVKAVDQLPVPGHVVEQLRDHYWQNSRRNLVKAGVLVRVLERLEGAGIAAIPYKGPTLAAMAYGDLGLREFADLDLLVGRRDLGRAREVLLGQGFRVAYHLTPAQERRLLRSKRQLPLLLDGQHLVELHTELFHPAFGFKLSHEAIRRRLRPVLVANRPVATCCPEDLLVILCAHGAKHYWRSLGWICDVAELMRAERTLDWDSAFAAADAAGGKRMCALGVFLATEFLAAPVPSEIAASIGREAAVRACAAGVARWLFAPRGPTAGDKAWFLLRVRDRLQDGLRDILSRLLVLPKMGHP